jgi:hypothetical protein
MWLAAGASLANCLGTAADREIPETAHPQARWQSDRQEILASVLIVGGVGNRALGGDGNAFLSKTDP